MTTKQQTINDQRIVSEDVVAAPAVGLVDGADPVAHVGAVVAVVVVAVVARVVVVAQQVGVVVAKLARGLGGLGKKYFNFQKH